jgi:hypothetical protein
LKVKVSEMTARQPSVPNLMLIRCFLLSGYLVQDVQSVFDGQ